MLKSAEEFHRLRLSENPDEYNRAAREEATDDVWLDVIARFPDLKIWVAYNKTVSLSILRVLARDPDPRVRRSVADKRKLDAELFDLLSLDEDSSVRASIAHNPKVPAVVLRRLLTDRERWIADIAAERLAHLVENPKTTDTGSSAADQP